MNKLTNITVLLPAVVLAAGTVSANGPAEWAQPAGDDLRIESLPASTQAVVPSRHTESQPVSYAWALNIDDSAPAPSGPAMESRQYWVDTTGHGLEKGLKLPLSAAGALVRISALNADTGALLDADRLQVSVDGQSLSVGSGAGSLEVITGSDLQSQGMSVPTDSLAFKLPGQGQPDTLNLQLAGAPADQAMVVHVFEPESPWVGKLSAGRHNYLAGGQIELDVGLTKGDERFAAQSIQAVLVSPDAAQDWPLEVTADGFKLAGEVPQELPAAGEGLYEVHAYLQGRQGETMIRRDLKVAIDIAVPTARLTERIRSRDGRGLTVDLGVEVASAGRYQVSGQVWGTASDGTLQPLAMAQTAAVLEPGESQLALEVPADLMRASGLSAPFQVREVQLIDQGRMSVQESRARGFTIGWDPGESRRPFNTMEQ